MLDVKLGQALLRRDYLAFFNNDRQEFKLFNYSFELLNDNELSKYLKNTYLVLALNKPVISKHVIGFKYLATHTPTESDIPQVVIEGERQPITFNEIANASTGDKLLGYLKLDIDNLGELFRSGFTKGNKENIKPSISRFATLSRMLETFFCGYINIKMKTDYKEMYTVFSGGDDLFLIGPWDKSIEFLQNMRNDFSRFCANNPDLTFSAGIIFVKPHEPISFCAEKVEEKLKTSKSHSAKNRITIFNQTIKWKELDRVIEEAHRVMSWMSVEPPIITRSLVYNFRKYGEMNNKFKETREIQHLKFVPLLTDDINRNLKKGIQKEAFAWAEDLKPSSYHPEGGANLKFLKIIMEYILTFTRR